MPTGTVDFVTTTEYFFIFFPISLATDQTYLRSASSSNLLLGVPTVIKIKSASFILSLKEEEKDKSFVSLRCFDNTVVFFDRGCYLHELIFELVTIRLIKPLFPLEY